MLQCFVDDELAFAGWEAQFGEQLVFGQIVEILGVAEPIATGFQTANGFLEGFLVGLADGHELRRRLSSGCRACLRRL